MSLWTPFTPLCAQRPKLINPKVRASAFRPCLPFQPPLPYCPPWISLHLVWSTMRPNELSWHTCSYLGFPHPHQVSKFLFIQGSLHSFIYSASICYEATWARRRLGKPRHTREVPLTNLVWGKAMYESTIGQCGKSCSGPCLKLPLPRSFHWLL